MNTTFTNCAEKKAKQFLNLLQGYTKGIRITAILILLLMGVNNAWAANLYLNPNSNWKSDGARFAAYFFGNGEKWVSMTQTVEVAGTTYYKVEVPSGFTKVIFCRMNPSAAANNWDNKWNQTGDLTIPTNGNNVFDKTNDTWNGATSTWKKIELSITYKDQNDATFSGTHADGYPTKHIYDGGETTLKTASKSGYNFEGWYKEKTCTNKVTSLGATAYTANITLYAKWTEKTYTVTINNDGHGTTTPSGAQSNVGQVKGVEISATANNGYQFKNWTIASGSGSFTNKNAASTTFKPTEESTVQANFTANTYTVTFNANDGTNNTADQNFTYDVEQKLSQNTFERADYKFAGWNTKEDGTGTKYDDQQSVKNLTDENNGVITLYAQWAPAQDTYEVTIKANGNGTVSPESVIVNKSITAEVTATPNEGHKFIGWKTEGGAEVADKDPVSTANASSTTVTAVGAGSVTANFEALLPNTLTLTQQAMYKERENPIDGVPGCDGTEANPYKIYSEEFVRITAEALPEVEGLIAYYKFGDKEQVENVFDFSEISGTTPSKITVKAYYKKDATVWGSELTTDSYYFLRIPLPYYVSTVPSGEMSLNSIADGENITVQFRSDDKTTVNLYVQTGDDSSTKTHLRRISNTASYDYTYDVPNNLEPCVLRFIAESEGLHNGRSFSKYAEVALYKNVTIKVNDPNNVLRKVYMWRGEDVKTQWPGEDFIKTFGTWRIFTVKYPYYDHFILNDGTQENQTFDYIIPAEDKCYQLSENKVEVGGYTNYQITETTCPSDLLVGDIDAVTVGVGEQKVVIPSVEVGVGYQISDLVTTVSSSNTSKATAVVSGKNIIVTGKSTGSSTITVTYRLDGTTVRKTFNVTVAAATNVTIQVKVPIASEGTYVNIGWEDNSKLYLHYWETEKAGNSVQLSYLGEETGKYKHLQAEIPLYNGTTNFLVYYEDMSAHWKKSPDVTNVTTDGCYAMKNEGYEKQPSISRTADYCWVEYQVKTLMQSGKEFTSNIVADANGIMSFFAPGKDETGRKAGAVMLYCNGSVVAAIDPATFETSTVYTATINDEGNGLENVAPYTGNYYIRTWGKNNDISNKGTQSVSTWTAAEKSSRSMTFFISREGEYYNHYWIQAMEPYNGGKDVSAWVANDYNDDLAGKLTGDKNTNENGDIKFDNTMNVRFGYDPRTNYFGRAILRGSGQNQDYLNLHCNNAYSDANCTTKLPYGTSNTANKFRDISNWVYEREVYVKIDNNNPTASMYIEALSPRNDKTVKNHLLGYVINEATGAETSNPIQKIVIASGTDNGVYKIRVVYDFKTNRMISVWEPNGDIEVSTKKTLKTDILFLRKENNPAPQITLTGDGRINSIQSVFFALELVRGDENVANRHEEQYMFTLPFDCVVGSISGVPGYMETWGIQRYRGDLRAQKGWYAETATFWEWMSLTDTLKAGEGYLLAFDKKNAHWEEFLEEDLVTKTSLLRLYFPSVQKGFDLQQQSVEQLTRTYEDHTCTLTLHDRYKYDSNWKMIGTTSYNNATVSGYVQDNDPGYEEFNKAPSFRYKYSYTFDNNNNRTSYNYDPELGSGDNVVYQSFYGYMVQFAGTITWSPINETVPESLAAPRRAQAVRSSVTMRLELANIDLEKQDQTFVALDEKGTTTFDQNLDLNKVFNSGKANIYTLSEDIPFAGNTLPMEEAVVPVGVDIATAGEYTFRMPDGTEGMVVELIDYELETTTNLLLFDYTVTLPKGTNEGRFALHIQPSKSGVTTNIDQINGGSMHHEGVQKYLIDGKLIIRTAEGEVFDAQGHRL